MSSLDLRGAALLVLAAGCSAGGIVLMKSGITQAAWLTVLLPGLVIYGTGVAIGLILIARYPISLAYPALNGLSLAALAGISAVALGEHLSNLKIGGTALIILGVVLLVRPDFVAAKGDSGDA